MQLRLEQLSKHYGLQPAIHGVSLQIHEGELVALLGPSGCGKTTLLRTLAGLESLSAGQIWFGDQEASQLSVQARRVGFVFQHYALFRHLSVFDNVAFGLTLPKRRDRLSKAAISTQVQTLLQIVQLSDLAHRKPDQLSGGQRQRVALARALAINPQVLLLDEPFGALDAQVRRGLRQWLRALHDELQLTTVMVTHDQEEALELADRVVVMNQGRIEQVGTPREVYEAPASVFVMDFLGEGSRLSSAQVAQWLEIPWTQAAGRVVYVRPDEVTVQLQAPRQRALQVQVVRVGWHAGQTLLTTQDESGHVLEVSVRAADIAGSSLQPGQIVYLQPQRLHGFDGDTGQRLPDGQGWWRSGQAGQFIQ